jgi:hypothetical protein
VHVLAVRLAERTQLADHLEAGDRIPVVDHVDVLQQEETAGHPFVADGAHGTAGDRPGADQSVERSDLGAGLFGRRGGVGVHDLSSGVVPRSLRVVATSVPGERS